MGLDIYAYAVPEGEEKAYELRHHFHYWRKHDGFLHWCEKLAKSRGEPGAEDSSFSIALTWDNVDELEQAIEDGELNKVAHQHCGYAVDWKPHDLLFVQKAQLVFALDRKVVITADW